VTAVTLTLCQPTHGTLARRPQSVCTTPLSNFSHFLSAAGLARPLGWIGGEVWDRSSDVDVVELALAILDEETRAWVTRPARRDAAPAPSVPDEQEGGDT
jgi:hypothetical protein